MNRVYINITTYSEKIVNRPLERGEQIFRVFGPKGLTHDISVSSSTAAGNPRFAAGFWGLGREPKNAEEWRLYNGAVLDEWNHNGFMMVGAVTESGRIKACTGKIAEQPGDRLPGQYLPGGGKQAIIETPPEVSVRLNQIADAVMADGKSRSASLGGVDWLVKPTHWTDVNGIHGYRLDWAGQFGVQAVRLGARETYARRQDNPRNRRDER